MRIYSLFILSNLLAFATGNGVIVGQASAKDATAIFAGGCFWCLEKDLEHVAGVKKVVSGYTDGRSSEPSYENRVKNGFRDVVRVTFDQSKLSYDNLLHAYWRKVDPTDPGGQFCDRGHAFTSAIYATSNEQKKIAQASKAALMNSGLLKRKVVTPVLMAKKFYAAEPEHQNYYKKNPGRYKFYRFTCRRDAKIRRVWSGSP